MSNYNQEIGRIGENKAKNYLVLHGYKILETNFRTRFGEIDIIAEKDGCVCFVEVKTRTNDKFGRPIEAISYYKQQNMLKAAKTYIMRKGYEFECRFDAVEVLYNPNGIFKKSKIFHLKNIYLSQ